MNCIEESMAAVAPVVSPNCISVGTEPLLVSNLLQDFAGLRSLLASNLRSGTLLNTYLLAAGLNQIVEDYIHRDSKLMKGAKHASRLGRPAGPIAVRGLHSANMVMWRRLQRESRFEQLLRWQKDFADFVQCLADALVGSPETMLFQAESWKQRGAELLAPVDNFPLALLRTVLRLPSCFRSFDQRPADLQRLAVDFAHGWPDRHRSLLVIGVRTSGSYLAPLLAAYLKRQGYRTVNVLTLRPGRLLLDAERRALQLISNSDDLALLTDDPPASGDSLSRAARQLEGAGVPHRSIVMLLQLFGPRDSLPSTLQKYATVLLPSDQWAIHRNLTSDHVAKTVGAFLGPSMKVEEITQVLSPSRQWHRSHVSARYRVRYSHVENGCQEEGEILAKGVGLGYFGEHALAVAQGLGSYIPTVYGLRDGLLYRSWLPDALRLTSAGAFTEARVAEAISAYVVDRSQALPVEEDVSLRQVGNNPVWQQTSDLLGQAFGGVAPLIRPILHATAQRLLRVDQPSVIDGSMGRSRWFIDETGGGGLRKIDFDERAFSNRDRYCFDPVFDLAGAASHDEGNLAERLRRAYSDRTGTLVGEERWLLYRLLHLRDQDAGEDAESPENDRLRARVFQQYYHKVMFQDLPVPESGALCAIDIDGVLETGWFGCSSISPAGALALRALSVHGCRPILCSGRSLDEVRERCKTYRLTGGVAEYGAVAYKSETESVHELLTDADCADLQSLRMVLSQFSGLHLDPAYRYAVRAYRRDATGKRCGLQPDVVASALERSGMRGRVLPIIGVRQTDFMVAGVNKGTGLSALSSDLGPREIPVDGKPLAFAIGDTAADLPMLRLATSPFAPANADHAFRREGIPVMDRPYQAGIIQAVTRFLGHRPGGCPDCRAPNLNGDAYLLLIALAAQDARKWGKLRQALLLAWKLMH